MPDDALVQVAQRAPYVEELVGRRVRALAIAPNVVQARHEPYFARHAMARVYHGPRRVCDVRAPVAPAAKMDVVV